MKKAVLLLFLLVCVFAAGCGEGTSDPSYPSSGPSGAPSASSSPNVPSEPAAISEPAVSDGSEESSAGGGIVIPPDETLAVYPGLCFRLPSGWQADPAPAQELLFFASSADGASSVSAAYTATDTMQGLTEALLIKEFRRSLSAAWEDAGATGVKAASVSVLLSEESHEALSLTASMDGKTVCQLQVYLLRNDGLYTLTVTAGDLTGAKALLAAFEAE